MDKIGMQGIGENVSRETWSNSTAGKQPQQAGEQGAGR